jgi:ribosomal protein S18 acetylase RimI-like enzyme
MWFATGFPSPALNRVLRLQLAPAMVAFEIDRIAEVARRRNAPMVFWVAPDSTPGDLGVRLAAHGASHVATAPGMAVDLGAVAAPAAIDGLRIVPVDGREDRRRFGTIAGGWFGAEAAAAFGEIEQGLGTHGLVDRPRYLGFLHGEAVASVALVLEGGVAGIYSVATEPSARRRGIGGAMTAYALGEAQRRGYRVGVLQATDAGYPVYRRLGFEDVIKFELYVLQPRPRK